MAYKIVVFGSGSVGKSALSIQFVQNIFIDKYDPTVEDNYQIYPHIDGEQCCLEILDTAGTESFSTSSRLHTKNGDGFLLVYSITSPNTLQDLIEIKDQIDQIKESSDFSIVLVGNKSDLANQREVTHKQGVKMSQKFDCPFFECSAKMGSNVEKAFHKLVREIKQKRIHTKPNVEKKRIKSKCTLL
jgi:small GTP-binding protein